MYGEQSRNYHEAAEMESSDNFTVLIKLSFQSLQRSSKIFEKRILKTSLGYF